MDAKPPEVCGLAIVPAETSGRFNLVVSTTDGLVFAPWDSAGSVPGAFQPLVVRGADGSPPCTRLVHFEPGAGADPRPQLLAAPRERLTGGSGFMLLAGHPESGMDALYSVALPTYAYSNQALPSFVDVNLDGLTDIIQVHGLYGEPILYVQQLPGTEPLFSAYSLPIRSAQPELGMTPGVMRVWPGGPVFMWFGICADTFATCGIWLKPDLTATYEDSAATNLWNGALGGRVETADLDADGLTDVFFGGSVNLWRTPEADADAGIDRGPRTPRYTEYPGDGGYLDVEITGNMEPLRLVDGGFL